MFLKSIRFKITILFMAILALILISFSAMLYHNVSTSLYNGMDTLLKSKAGGISQSINTYWEVSNLEAIAASVKSDDILRKRRNTNFTRVAQRWVREESSDPTLLNIVVAVFDTDGAIIASSKNMQTVPQIPGKDFISVLQGKSRFDTVMTESPTAKMAMRIYTTPVFENEKVAYIVQIASPLTSIQVALNNLKIALFVLFPITVLVTGIMGTFLAKATLRPVNNIIHTIHQITAENMKLRITIPDTRDEIRQLAETFNDMLGRLEGAFMSQRKLFEDLSHELKTPLTILKGEFEVVLKKMRAPGEYEAILKSSLEETNRIIKLAENLLFLARVDSKEVFPEKKMLDLNLLIHAIINSVKRAAEIKNIQLVFTAGNELILNGDEGQLKILFLNLLDNAVKYTPQDGKIIIVTERAGQSARVTIKDTGIGIPKEDMEHIFDRFYRTDKSRDSAGFGLGLSIAKAIANAHNGDILAESRQLQGSIFTVVLPVAVKS